MQNQFINLGFGTVIAAKKVVAVLPINSPSSIRLTEAMSAPLKAIKDVAKEKNKLIDATYGRRTRSIIITDNDHVILSSVEPKTIVARINSVTAKTQNR